MKQQQ